MAFVCGLAQGYVFALLKNIGSWDMQGPIGIFLRSFTELPSGKHTDANARADSDNRCRWLIFQL